MVLAYCTKGCHSRLQVLSLITVSPLARTSYRGEQLRPIVVIAMTIVQSNLAEAYQINIVEFTWAWRILSAVNVLKQLPTNGILIVKHKITALKLNSIKFGCI